MRANVMCPNCGNTDFKGIEGSLFYCECEYPFSIYSCAIDIKRDKNEMYVDALNKLFKMMREEASIHINGYAYSVKSIVHNSEKEIKLELKFEGE